MAEISQNVNIEMLERLPDGTYKRKYPKTRADDGTTFDEHLADYVTLVNSKGRPGGIAQLDETGNVPRSQLGNVPVGWMKISSVTTSEVTTELEFTDLEDYEEFQLLIQTRKSNSETRASDIKINFNDDTGSNYSRATVNIGSDISVSSDGSATRITLIAAVPRNTLSFALSRVNISNLKDKPKYLQASYAKDSVTAGLTFGRWKVNTEKINKITLASTSDFAEGSVFEIWGVK